MQVRCVSRVAVFIACVARARCTTNCPALAWQAYTVRGLRSSELAKEQRYPSSLSRRISHPQQQAASVTVSMGAPLDTEVDFGSKKRARTDVVATATVDSVVHAAAGAAGQAAGPSSIDANPSTAATAGAVVVPEMPWKKRRKRGEHDETPAGQLTSQCIRMIQMAAKDNDLPRGMEAFKTVVSNNLRLPATICNSLLYVCCGGNEWERLARRLPPKSGSAATAGTEHAPDAASGPATDCGAEASGADAAVTYSVADFAPGSAVAEIAAALAMYAQKAAAAEAALKAEKLAAAIAAGKKRFVPQPAKQPLPLPPVDEMLAFGSTVWEYMQRTGIPGDLATFTSLARLEAIRGNAAEALQWAMKTIEAKTIAVQLRLFHPALVSYCLKGDVDQVFALDQAIAAYGLDLSEFEFARLLEVVAMSGTQEQWAAILKRAAAELNGLSPATLAIIENYYRSERAAAAVTGEGGQSFSRWQVMACTVDPKTGYSEAAGEAVKLVDLADEEWAFFAEGIASLAVKNESRPDSFKAYREWHDRNGPFDILIDGANIAFYGQNRPGGGFNWPQLVAMMRLLRTKHPNARILLMLHKKRAHDPEAMQPAVQQFLAELKSRRQFYTTPPGSNDDWYWLYATVKAKGKGLLISNDELRDHIFGLLRPKHFLKWKTGHIAHYTFVNSVPELMYPASFTPCIQRMDNGTWMFPAAGEGGHWLCVKPVGQQQASDVGSDQPAGQ